MKDSNKRKPKVLLIRANPCHEGYSHDSHRSICPPLGIMYLAAVLRDRYPREHDIQLLDPGLEDMTADQVGEYVEREKPDLIGISSLASELHDCYAIINACHQAWGAARIVVGGPASETSPKEIAMHPAVTCVGLGEGEETFAELVPKLLADESIDEVAGLCLRGQDGHPHITGPRAAIEDLDNMPFPAWDLIDVPAYSEVRTMNYGLIAAKPYVPVFTSRGCPWKCTYCHTLFGKKVRYRSPENVLQEMSMLVATYGIKEFHFYDDIFNVDGPRSGQIMDMIAERDWGLHLAFPNGLRGDILTEDLIRRYRKAGTYIICFAIETVTPRLQKLIKKNVKLDKLEPNIRIARDAGIIPLGFFMLGFPGETTQEIQATVDWACNSALQKAYFFSVVPFEGTTIHEQAQEVTPNFDFDPTVTYHTESSYYSQVTGVDMVRVQRMAYFRFYTNPFRLLGFFANYPIKTLFFKNAAYAAKGLIFNKWRTLRA